MMKNFSILTIVFCTLLSCSETIEQDVEVLVEKNKPLNNNHLLKGHQDQMQKAKDMEKEMLKKAEQQKKAIKDATG